MTMSWQTGPDGELYFASSNAFDSRPEQSLKRAPERHTDRACNGTVAIGSLAALFTISLSLGVANGSGSKQTPVIDEAMPMHIPDNARLVKPGKHSDPSELKYVIWNEDIKEFRCGGDIKVIRNNAFDTDHETTKSRHKYIGDTLSRSVVVCFNTSGFIDQTPVETFPSQHIPQLNGVNP